MQLFGIDRYTLVARCYPAALIVSPIALAAYNWAPFTLAVAKGSVSAAILVALAYAFSNVTRDAGRRAEEKLLVAWGGWPSTAVLRHRDATFDPVSTARFHEKLVALGAVPRMPSKQEETDDPALADQSYSAAGTWLRTATRDAKKYPLVFEENVNYGYRRNLFGCRWIGMSIGAAVLLFDSSAAWLGRSNGLAACASLLLLAYLVAVATPNGVRRVSETYARRLIECIDEIPTAPRKTPRRKAA